jgi:hypothetical protein
MKRFLIAAAVAAITATTVTNPALAADVAVSLSVGQPGFYGRLDLGDYPQPQVIYSQPIVVEQVAVERPPIYLRVPPGQAKHWSKHCREYNACGERVYFVQDNWYNHEYVPRYREQHRDEDRGEHGNNHHGNNHEQGHDH